MPRQWDKILTAADLQSPERFNRTLQRVMQYAPEKLRAQILTRLSDLNPKLLDGLLTAGVISLADFKPDDIKNHIFSGSLDSLNTLVVHGADPAAWCLYEWFPYAILRIASNRGISHSIRWLMQRTSMLPALEKMNWNQSSGMGTVHYDMLKQDKAAAACLLWFAARHDHRCVLLFSRFSAIRTRTNFLAHNGRALRALINKRHKRFWLGKLQWLSVSDLASVGLEWSSFI
jgi:hypothetical protein